MEETSERRTSYYVYGPEPVRPRFERRPEEDTGEPVHIYVYGPVLPTRVNPAEEEGGN